MSCLTPPRPPLRIIKITSDEPSIFITHRDPTKTPKHPRLSLPPPSPYSAPIASSSSPSRQPFFKTSNHQASPSRKRKERSESVVCLSSPVASGSSTTRPERSRKPSPTTRVHALPLRVAPGRRTGIMDDSDDDVIPPLAEALHLSSGGGSSRSRMVSEDVRGLRETAKTWLEDDDLMSARKKEKVMRAARLVELQSRRRKPPVSPSTSPSPAPVSPTIRKRGRESSTGMMDTSDSVTQPTTPYDNPLHQRRSDRPGWSTSPVLSPIVQTRGPSDQVWTRHETPEMPASHAYEQVGDASAGDTEKWSRSAQKGKGKVSLDDLFIDDEADDDPRRLSFTAHEAPMVHDGQEEEAEGEESQIDELDDNGYEIDELADDDGMWRGQDNIERGETDRGDSDEYDDDEFDNALADVDPDSFSPSVSGPSRPKTLGSMNQNVMDVDSDFAAPLGQEKELPLTQFDLSGVDFFTDDYDLPVLAPHNDDEDTVDSGGIPSPIVLIHEMEEEYQEFFNEHWRRGADGARRQFDQPERRGSGTRGTRGRARGGGAGTAAKKKFWATRGRGRGRGRARAGARRQ